MMGFETITRVLGARHLTPHNDRENRHLQEVSANPADIASRSEAIKSAQGRLPNFPKTSLNNLCDGGQG